MKIIQKAHIGKKTVFADWAFRLSWLLLLSRFSHVRLCAAPETAAHQATPSLGLHRQEHWSGLPFPSPVHESEKWKRSRSVVSDSSDPMDCSLPGSSVHGIFQAKVLQWGAIASCRQTWACWLYVSGFVDLPLCFWLECYRVLFKQGPGNVEAGYSSFTSKKESIPRTLMLYN